MTAGPNPHKGGDLYRRSATGLANDLASGKFSARHLLDYFLDRIQALNPQLNAFIFLDPAAQAAADESDARRREGRTLGPLDGIPVAVKDNLLMQNCPAVWGSPLYADHIASHDELPVARLRESGAVLIGKTNVPELAMRGHTDNAVFGVTGNPWNPVLTPGGSSGGAVSAVAAGLVPLSLTTDGGGSIRRPAAHTGLVGLKPTIGRVRRGLGFPPLMFDCEVVGPIARTVADARAMFQVLAQKSLPSHRNARKKILLVEHFGGAPVDPEILASTRGAAEILAALGHEVQSGPLPFSIETAMAAWQTVSDAGFARLARMHANFADLSAPDFVARAENGARLSAADYAEAVEALFAFRAIVADAFDRVDIIMTPATAAQPWPANEHFPSYIANEKVGPRGHAVFTAWVNACGNAAIAVPVEPAKSGMPIGIQLVGAWDADEMLLDVAEGFEAAHPWSDRWPAMASAH